MENSSLPPPAWLAPDTSCFPWLVEAKPLQSLPLSSSYIFCVPPLLSLIRTYVIGPLGEDLISRSLILLHLQRSFFQKREHTQVPGIWNVDIILGGGATIQPTLPTKGLVIQVNHGNVQRWQVSAFLAATLMGLPSSIYSTAISAFQMSWSHSSQL